MTSVPSHVTPLRLVQLVGVDLARVLPLFGDQATTWLGTPVAATRPGSHRYLTDLSLPIREHAPSLVFRKAAYVDLGEMRRTADGCEIEIGWQSSSLAPLFPVFAGHLTLTPTEVRLEGFYAPPGGEIGAALDRVFLSIAARGTARWFLERTTEVVAAAATAGLPEKVPTARKAASATD
ncbi:MAG: hypothetical protein ABSC46_10150 [Candidatus Limnocylindrales bacterium]|jgi:hypothetical protein